MLRQPKQLVEFVIGLNIYVDIPISAEIIEIIVILTKNVIRDNRIPFIPITLWTNSYSRTYLNENL